MDHPYGKQYGQEGNPRAYMTMRDYRTLPYQWGNQQPVERNPNEYMSMRDYRNLELQNQQPVGRNPNPNMSLREYRDKYMSGPVYSVPSTYPPPLQYDHPEPRPREDEGQRYSSYQGESIHTISEKTLIREKLTILTRRLDEMEMKNQHNIHSVNEFSASQPSCYNYQSPQPPQSIHPILEQAILDLTRKVNDYVEENKKICAHSIVIVEDNLNKKMDGLKDDFEHQRDNLQDSIGDLIEHQQPPPLSLVEQAILNLSKQVDNFIENNRVVNVQTIREIETVKSSLNKRTDGLQSEIDQKLDIQQESILKLVPQFVHQEEKNLEEESQEKECLTGTILGEQVQLQPQEELEVELVKAPEDLQEPTVNFWPWTNEEQITALLTEKSSGHEGTQEPIIQPNPQAIPIDLDTIATAQDTKTPLPVAPSDDQVYILPTPAENPKPSAPAPKGKSNPLPAAPSTDQVYILPASQSQHKTPAAPKAKSNSLHAMQNLKILVASVHTFATTSKKMANAYIAWHSGWFGCGFGFGTPGPRHF